MACPMVYRYDLRAFVRTPINVSTVRLSAMVSAQRLHQVSALLPLVAALRSAIGELVKDSAVDVVFGTSARKPANASHQHIGAENDRVAVDTSEEERGFSEPAKQPCSANATLGCLS